MFMFTPVATGSITEPVQKHIELAEVHSINKDSLV